MKKIVLMLLLVASAFLLCSCGTKELDCSKIVKAEFSGVSGKGTVNLSFDDELFDDRKFLDALFPDYKRSEAAENLEDIYEELEISVEPAKGLKNGDKIKVEVECNDEELLKDYKVKLTKTEFDLKVKGLKEIEKVDGFEGVEVKFEGLDTKGKFSVDNSKVNDVTKRYASYDFDNAVSGTLKNGDIVTITINYDQDYMNDEGYDFKETSKDFTVAGLTEVKLIDPFENLNFTFTGSSPFVRVATDATATNTLVQNYVNFTFEDIDYKNGDTVTITANVDDYYAEENAFALSTTTKELKIENCAEFVSSLDGLDLSTIESEMADKRDQYYADNTNSYKVAGIYYYDYKSVSEPTLKSKYWLALKGQYIDQYSPSGYTLNFYNYYRQVYEYEVTTSDNKKEKVYLVVSLNDIAKDADGNISYNLELGAKGYESYDELIKDYVDARKDYYNVAELK